MFVIFILFKNFLIIVCFFSRIVPKLAKICIDLDETIGYYFFFKYGIWRIMDGKWIVGYGKNRI
jgi:hypothetical protein